jgi:hypothetical protein
METARWCWSASSSSQPHVTRLAEIVHATRRRPTYSTLLLHLRRCGNRSHLTCHRDELVALRRSSSACRCFACRVRHLSPHPVGSLAASMIITSFKVVLLVFSVVASSKRKFMFWPLPCAVHLTAAVIVANKRHLHALQCYFSSRSPVQYSLRSPLSPRLTSDATAPGLIVVTIVARHATEATELPNCQRTQWLTFTFTK